MPVIYDLLRNISKFDIHLLLSCCERIELFIGLIEYRVREKGVY
jgi:hypothetical protein